MQLKLFFSILSVLSFMVVVWMTILYQLEGNVGFFTGILIAGTFVYAVWSVLWDFLWYH